MDQHYAMTPECRKPLFLMTLCISLICALVTVISCGGGGGGGAPAAGNGYRPAMVSLKILVTEPTNTTVPITLRTGMIFGNEEDVIMTPVSGSSGTWQATISAPEGTILRYMYRLNGDWNQKEMYEHRQGQFHYRELLVVKNAVVNDTISRWEGSLTTGRPSTPRPKMMF